MFWPALGVDIAANKNPLSATTMERAKNMLPPLDEASCWRRQGESNLKRSWLLESAKCLSWHTSRQIFGARALRGIFTIRSSAAATLGDVRHGSDAWKEA